MTNKEIQNIAKQTIEYIKTKIYVGQSLEEIRNLCESKMFELGADSFWYYNIGAFIFSGNDTTVSISGRKYKTPDRKILLNDIITIDLSPQFNHLWGDYARTIIVENGQVINCINDIQNNEWQKGLLFEEKLHSELINFSTPDTTFEELYF
ncbi:MAG: aminopeptidase P family protein, partial [Eubacterium sp.]|nr:aminopeptidase P family protein [Eubacterium sp.]